MTNWIIPSAIFAAAVVTGAAVVGGRYAASQGPQGTLYIVDRFTGAARWCNVKQCRELGDQEVGPPERGDQFVAGECVPTSKKP